MVSLSASKQNAPFRFLNLPPKLRNHIYADIFTATYVTCRPLPKSFPPAAGLTILRVSKSVYQEARHVLYQSGTFYFHIPRSGPTLYQDLSAKPLTDLMQNVTLDLYAYPDPAALRCANSLLHCFSDPTIPRIRCTVFLWPDSDQFLSQVSFLDSLGKLAGFRTVLLIHFGEMNIIQGPTFKTLDEYLSVTLGPGEPSFGVHDWRFKRCHCLTYHPGRHACGVQGKEITDRGVLSTMVSMFLD